MGYFVLIINIRHRTVPCLMETSEEETEETISEPITETIVVPFAENIDNWQFAAQDFALKGDCEEVTVLVRYSKHAQTVLISNIELSNYQSGDGSLIDG